MFLRFPAARSAAQPPRQPDRAGPSRAGPAPGSPRQASRWPPDPSGQRLLPPFLLGLLGARQTPAPESLSPAVLAPTGRPASKDPRGASHRQQAGHARPRHLWDTHPVLAAPGPGALQVQRPAWASTARGSGGGSSLHLVLRGNPVRSPRPPQGQPQAFLAGCPGRARGLSSGCSEMLLRPGATHRSDLGPAARRESSPRPSLPPACPQPGVPQGQGQRGRPGRSPAERSLGPGPVHSARARHSPDPSVPSAPPTGPHRPGRAASG